MDIYYYSNPSTLMVSNKSYDSYWKNINIFNKEYDSYINTINLSSKIYSSESYYDASFKVVYSWGKDRFGDISDSKYDVTILNKLYENTIDNILG